MTTLAGFSHVALTVTDLEASMQFYSEAMGLPVLDSNDSYCALVTQYDPPAALILTTHEQTATGAFTELRAGLDHVSLAVPDHDALAAWTTRLEARGVPFDAKRSEWGHHVNLRDPDGIAVELVLMQPDDDVQTILDEANDARG